MKTEEGRVSPSVIDRLGHTPLVRLRAIERSAPHVELYAKLEWYNPGGSVKDRPAFRMILHGERTGQLTPDKIILDATSGNTGISYALLGAAKGYRVQLCAPANMSVERKRILKAYGAELVLTDPAESSDGAILKARELSQAHPERYFYPDQYGNPENWRAHYETTAVEIWEQTQGELTHFVAGVGTSGTLMGAGRRLKELNPAIRVVEMQPAEPFHGLEGLKHMASSIQPKIYDPQFADQRIGVQTESAHELVKRLAREEGLLVGVSSGGALAACLALAKQVPSGRIVTIFPDSGDKYLSERFWEEGA